MGISIFTSAVAVASLIVASSTAQATMVQPVSGQVMINQGQGYKTIKNPIELKTGDQVIVNPGGFAKVNYTDGCSIPVQPGAVATIGAQSPCVAQSLETSQGAMVQTQAVGDGDNNQAAAPGLTGEQIAIGLGITAAVVGVTCLASWCDSGSNKRPASP